MRPGIEHLQDNNNEKRCKDTATNALSDISWVKLVVILHSHGKLDS